MKQLSGNSKNKNAMCKKCNRYPATSETGTCNACLVATLGRRRYRENPKARRQINDIQKNNPAISLVHVAFHKEFTDLPFTATNALSSQARLMIQEQTWGKI